MAAAVSRCDPTACLAAAQQAQQAAAAAKATAAAATAKAAKAAADAEYAQRVQAANERAEGEQRCAQFSRVSGVWTEYDSGRPINQVVVGKFEYEKQSNGLMLTGFDCQADCRLTNALNTSTDCGRVFASPDTGRLGGREMLKWGAGLNSPRMVSDRLCYSGSTDPISRENLHMRGDGCMTRGGPTTAFYADLYDKVWLCGEGCGKGEAACNRLYDDSPLCETNRYLCLQHCQ